jgi:hypothetical protein
MAIKLVELTDAAVKIKELMDKDPEGWQESLKDIEAKIEDKIIAYGIICKNLEAEANVFKEESEKNAKKASSLNNHVKFLMGKAEQAAIEINAKEIKSGVITAKWKKLPDMVEITDANILPESFKRIIPETKEPDKKAIKEALDKNEVVDGAKLIKDRRKWVFV